MLTAYELEYKAKRQHHNDLHFLAFGESGGKSIMDEFWYVDSSFGVIQNAQCKDNNTFFMLKSLIDAGYTKFIPTTGWEEA
jgi:hypothetical protein